MPKKAHTAIPSCEDPSCSSCPICDLYICSKCGLGEGSLTSWCPGTNVDLSETTLFGDFQVLSELVYQGKIDYNGDEWVTDSSPHSPASLFLKNAPEDSLK